MADFNDLLGKLKPPFPPQLMDSDPPNADAFTQDGPTPDQIAQHGAAQQHQPPGKFHQFLSQMLQNFAVQAPQNVGNALYARMAPQAFEQQQENLRQHAQLAQQLQMHNSITPYEQAQLQFQNLAHQDTVKDREAAAEKQANEFIAQHFGEIRPAKTPGASGNIHIGNKEFEQLPDAENPNKKKVTPESDIGKLLGLTEDEYYNKKDVLEYGLKAAEKKEQQKILNQQHRDIQDAVEKSRVQGHKDLDALFDANPTWKSDPAALIQKAFLHNQMDESAASDKRTFGNTQISSALKQAREFRPESQKIKDASQIAAAGAGSKLQAQSNFYNRNVGPDELKSWVDSYDKYGTKILDEAKKMDPSGTLASNIMSEGVKRGINPAALTNEELNTRSKAAIAVPHLAGVMRALNSPTAAKNLGAVAGRWQDFLNGKLGDDVSPEWKHIQDELIFVKGMLGQIHYGVRGGASPENQKTLGKLFDAGKMDVPTLKQGLRDVQAWVAQYSTLGSSTTPQPQGELPPIGNPYGQQ